MTVRGGDIARHRCGGTHGTYAPYTAHGTHASVGSQGRSRSCGSIFHRAAHLAGAGHGAARGGLGEHARRPAVNLIRRIVDYNLDAMKNDRGRR